jgi:hypothetical protein
VERSKIARISQRVEQVAEVLGRKPRAWLFADYGETNEQVVARYLARHPYLLRSAFGHDGLWVFANRIFANRIFSNRILPYGRRRHRGWLLARQVGGASSAQHGQQSNSDAQHADEPGRAQHS